MAKSHTQLISHNYTINDIIYLYPIWIILSRISNSIKYDTIIAKSCNIMYMQLYAARYDIFSHKYCGKYPLDISQEITVLNSVNIFYTYILVILQNAGLEVIKWQFRSASPPSIPDLCINLTWWHHSWSHTCTWCCRLSRTRRFHRIGNLSLCSPHHHRRIL